MNWFQRVVLWVVNRAGLAAVTAVEPGRENDGIDRQFGPAGTPLDRPWVDIYGDLNDALEAWDNNPLARRLIGLTTAYVLGAGVRLSGQRSDVKEFLDRFWHHPENRMDMRAEEWCDELARSGEVFLVLFTQADGMGVMRAIPASMIEEIEYQPGDYETELRFRETAPIGEPEKWWISPKHPDAGDVSRPLMLHYAINRPVGRLRGESDLAPILSWLRRYTRWLEDRVRLNAGIRAFLWVVYASRNLLGDLRDRYRTPPEPGSIIIAEKGSEEWSAITPNLHAQDADADGKSIRRMIAAGGLGTNLGDLGDSEEAGLARSQQAGEQRRRFLLRRQRCFVYLLSDVLVHAFNRYVAVHGGAPASLSDIVIYAPDISPEDNQMLAQAAMEAAQSLAEMRGIVGDSETFRRLALRLYAKYAGEDLSEREFEEIIGNGKRDTRDGAQGAGD